MTLILKRLEKREDGILSSLSKDGEQIAVCLEHAYDSGLGNGSYDAKLKSGRYKCVRGLHRLGPKKSQFETFEITGVPGHTGILFHVGNYNKDSDGCVLLGDNYGGDPRMIYNSRLTFQLFMDALIGANEINLMVEDL